MTRRSILPLLAILGLGSAVAAIVHGNHRAPVPSPAVEPAGAPFDSFVAGVGLVEASTGNIAIGSPVSGIATEIDVRVGDWVKGDDVLFRIDDRDLQAQLLEATARVGAAEAALLQPRHRLDFAENLKRSNPEGITDQALSDLRDGVAIAEANLALVKADVEQIRANIRRRTVLAPVAGRVLQLKLRLGEFVDDRGAAPLLLLGDDRTLFVRVDVDENDAPRVGPRARAVAFVRGHPEQNIPLQFEYIEPFIVPKTTLTGLSTERTDTRVLQVLYSFPSGDIPVYVGQQLDVFIEASPVNR